MRVGERPTAGHGDSRRARYHRRGDIIDADRRDLAHHPALEATAERHLRRYCRYSGEIKAGCSGTIVEVVAKNDEFVDFGSVLFRVDTGS